jgi:hypothetical protein
MRRAGCGAGEAHLCLTHGKGDSMNAPVRRKGNGDEGGRRVARDADQGPGLDEAGGISREELNPDRSGGRPVEQNDRTRDRQLEEPPLP